MADSRPAGMAWTGWKSQLMFVKEFRRVSEVCEFNKWEKAETILQVDAEVFGHLTHLTHQESSIFKGSI